MLGRIPESAHRCFDEEMLSQWAFCVQAKPLINRQREQALLDRRQHTPRQAIAIGRGIIFLQLAVSPIREKVQLQPGGFCQSKASSAPKCSCAPNNYAQKETRMATPTKVHKSKRSGLGPVFWVGKVDGVALISQS